MSDCKYATLLHCSKVVSNLYITLKLPDESNSIRDYAIGRKNQYLPLLPPRTKRLVFTAVILGSASLGGVPDTKVLPNSVQVVYGSHTCNLLRGTEPIRKKKHVMMYATFHSILSLSSQTIASTPESAPNPPNTNSLPPADANPIADRDGAAILFVFVSF
jgi:hypothetical protein